jgi:hypothetical protein
MTPSADDELIPTTGRDERPNCGFGTSGLVEHGRRKATREALARAIANEPTVSAGWVRSRTLEIRRW